MTPNMKSFSIQNCECEVWLIDVAFAFHGILCSPFTLSYKTIDPNSFFAIPEKLESIQASSADLEKIIEVNWPCSREEEVNGEK